MAITVKETTNKISIKYGADTGKGLSAYSVGIEVKDGETDENYYNLALAVMPLIDADERNATDPVLTITQIIE